MFAEGLLRGLQFNLNLFKGSRVVMNKGKAYVVVPHDCGSTSKSVAVSVEKFELHTKFLLVNVIRG